MKQRHLLAVLAVLALAPAAARGQARVNDFVVTGGASWESYNGNFSVVTVPTVDSTEHVGAAVGEFGARGTLSFLGGAKIGVIAILPAAAGIDADRLDVAVGMWAEPGVRIGRRQADGVEAINLFPVGDALARLLTKAGFKVTKEYYVNDAGAQVNATARALRMRYLQVLGRITEADFQAALERKEVEYGGTYLIPVAEALAKRPSRRAVLTR